MTLQTSGLITLNDIETEFEVNFKLSSYYDVDSGVPASGKISFSDFYGKSSLFVIKEEGTANAYTDAGGNFQELDLRTYLLSLGWNGTSAVEWQVNPGVYVWSDNISNPALNIENFPNGITIRNFGFIMGKGGDGRSISAAPGNGGPAIRYNNSGIPLVIINETSGHIGGGGGGGGGIRDNDAAGEIRGGGGGGAGGGRGGSTINTRHNNTTPFASGGTIGNFGSSGQGTGTSNVSGGSAGGGGGQHVNDGIGKSHDGHSSGGGGGRVMPGAASGSTGDGGSGGATSTGSGGNGGGGGGGGWGSAGGSNTGAQGTGGSGGKAVDIIAGSVTISSGGSRIYGAIV